MLCKDNVNTYVEVERHGLDDDALSGFVLDVNDDLALLNYVTNDFRLDGYCVVRTRDITACNLFDDPTSFQLRALRLKGVRSKKPKAIDLTNWGTVVESLAKQFPILIVHREEVSNDSCLVGRVIAVDDQSVTLHSISPTAAWEKKTRLMVAQMTRIDCGGGYEDALWKVASEGKHSV